MNALEKEIRQINLHDTGVCKRFDDRNDKNNFNRSERSNIESDTPKTEEKTTSENTEGNKSEAHRKRKKISSVYFNAQNASDGGKGKENRQQARERDRSPQNGGQRTQDLTQETVESGEQRKRSEVARIVLRAKTAGNRPEGSKRRKS